MHGGFVVLLPGNLVLRMQQSPITCQHSRAIVCIFILLAMPHGSTAQ